MKSMEPPKSCFLSEKVQKGGCKGKGHITHSLLGIGPKKEILSADLQRTLTHPINGGSLRYMCPTLFVTKYYQTKTLFLLFLAH